MAAGDRLEDAENEDLAPRVTPTATETVSRRGLLRRGLAFGVAAPVLLFALQACGDDEEDEEEGGDEPSAAPSPSRAGTSPSAAPSPSRAGTSPSPSPSPAGAASPSPGGISLDLPPTSAPQPSPPSIGG